MRNDFYGQRGFKRFEFDTDMNLKELSRHLGLSQTTVSRALNGYPEVSEATRIRVRLAAERSNYAPSARAKGLATGKALAIGHVIPSTLHHAVMNPIFGDFIGGAGEVYAREGFDMILSILDRSSTEENVYRSLHARKSVDGVVVHGPKMKDTRIALLQSLGMPFVVHGRASGISTPYSWIDVNNRHAFQRATDFLIDLGHRRIALLNGFEVMDFAFRRRGGFEDAMDASNLPIFPEFMVSDEMTEDVGYVEAGRMLSCENPPTAFLCSSMIMAMGARRAIEERGLVLGDDVSIITHDDHLSYLQNGGDVPIFTATRSSVRDAGRLVAEMLLQQIAEPTAKPQNQLLEAELMVGRSTGPAKS